MANLTQPTDRDVDELLTSVPNARRRADAFAIRDLMAQETGAHPVLWGPTMVGFGTHHYIYESGREGDSFIVGFAPRAAALTIYGIFSAYGNPLSLAELGPHTTGKSCVYVKDLSKIDQGLLAELIRTAWKTYS